MWVIGKKCGDYFSPFVGTPVFINEKDAATAAAEHLRSDPGCIQNGLEGVTWKWFRAVGAATHL